MTQLFSVSTIILLATIYVLVLCLLVIIVRQKNIYRDGKLYLIRWTIIKTPWFSLKVHKAVMSDPADHHDHPWNYTSLILWGGYTEETPLKFSSRMQKELALTYGWDTTRRQFYRPGSILFRRGDKPHRLIIPPGKSCTSLILTTRKWRDWGFVKDNQWVSHTKSTY